MNKKELWLRLKNYHFDHVVTPALWDHITAKFGGHHPSVRAFANKIARKHKWENKFARKAIIEYKKFVYLGLVSDFHVTPSAIIDVVWHEHLLFSKAYREFCADVIQQQFDHHPELLPMADQTGHFNAQYLDTIDLYKTEFAIEPPQDIWGNTKFDQEEIKRQGFKSVKKRPDDSGTSDYSDPPLHSYFYTESAASHPEFAGYTGDEFNGHESSGDWSDSTDSSSDGDSGGDGGGCSGGCGGGGD